MVKSFYKGHQLLQDLHRPGNATKHLHFRQVQQEIRKYLFFHFHSYYTGRNRSQIPCGTRDLYHGLLYEGLPKQSSIHMY